MTTYDDDVLFRGQVIVAGAGTLTLPASSVANANVVAAAGIEASKLQHQYHAAFAQQIGVDCVSESRVVHVVYGATGTVIDFRAGAVVVAGAATTVAVDLKKNGTTILSATITLNNTQAAYQEVAGTISSAGLVTGDVLSIHFTLSGTNEPQGVYARAVVREDAA